MELDKKLRVFILDTLVSQSGKNLTPDLIGQLTSELVERVMDVIGHDHEGSKTYSLGDKSVTLKTEMIYSLDKKAYASGEIFLPSEFDPIVQKVSYEVNKKLFNTYEQTAPADVRDMLHGLIEKKPSKPSVTIKDRT